MNSISLSFLNMKLGRYLFRYSAVILLFSLGDVEASFAQDDVLRKSVLDEIIVTARKRAESVQDVPISMSVMTGDQMREWGLQSSHQLASAVPNMVWQDDGTNVPKVYLRGIGDINFHINQQGGVGLYIDDVSLNSPALGRFPLYDLERVEVLRGPQNTLFGRNTTGGAIQFITRKPSIDAGTNGHLNVGYDSLDSIDVDGAVGFAMGENSAIRLAIGGTSRGDWMKNTTMNRNVGGYDHFAGRAQVLWQATDTVDVLLNLNAGTKQGDHLPDRAWGTRDPADPTIVDPSCAQTIGNGCVGSLGTVPASEFDTVIADYVGINDAEMAAGSLNIDWRLPSVTMTSVTAFIEADAQQNADSDSTPFNLAVFANGSDTKQWSQEFRLLSTQETRLRWLAGVYYFFEEGDWVTSFRFSPAVFPNDDGPQIVPNTVVSQDNDEWSIYGQMVYDLTESLTLTTGLRYTDETKDIDTFGAVGTWTSALFPASQYMGFEEIAIVNSGVTAPITSSPKKTWGEVGGNISLDYQYSDDTLIYASISRGFKGGTVSLAAFESLSGNPGRLIEPEFLLSYEVGAKTSWLDNSMQINAALFYNNWEDQQVFTAFAIGNVTGTFLVNIPESRSYGGELEMKFTAGNGWYVSGGLAYLDAQIEEAGTEFPNIDEGNVLPNSPNITFNGLIRKEWQLANGVLGLQTTFNYKDDVQYDLSESPREREDDFWILNARGSYQFGSSGQYEIALIGENITDTEYCMAIFDFTFFAAAGGLMRCVGNIGEPIYGASFSIDFD